MKRRNVVVARILAEVEHHLTQAKLKMGSARGAALAAMPADKELADLFHLIARRLELQTAELCGLRWQASAPAEALPPRPDPSLIEPYEDAPDGRPSPRVERFVHQRTYAPDGTDLGLYLGAAIASSNGGGR